MPTPYERNSPKSSEEIRNSLNLLHGKVNNKNPAGPFKDGFSADYQVVAGTFYDSENARLFQRQLSQNGIHSKSSSFKNTKQVIVDSEDSSAAAKIFLEHRAKNPDRIPSQNCRRFDFLIFLSGISFTIGIIVVMGQFHKPIVFAVLMAFTVFGAAIGHVVDRLRMRFSATGKYTFGVWDFLVLASVPGAIMVLARLVPMLF